MSPDHEPGGNEEGEIALGNLPPQLTELIGREDALRELSALVWRGRLLTLSGPGGAGKTRLAIALADSVRADFVEGGWFVDLSHTVDPGSVAQAIAVAVLPGRSVQRLGIRHDREAIPRFIAAAARQLRAGDRRAARPW